MADPLLGSLRPGRQHDPREGAGAFPQSELSKRKRRRHPSFRGDGTATSWTFTPALLSEFPVPEKRTAYSFRLVLFFFNVSGLFRFPGLPLVLTSGLRAVRYRYTVPNGFGSL